MELGPVAPNRTVGCPYPQLIVCAGSRHEASVGKIGRQHGDRRAHRLFGSIDRKVSRVGSGSPIPELVFHDLIRDVDVADREQRRSGNRLTCRQRYIACRDNRSVIDRRGHREALPITPILSIERTDPQLIGTGTALERGVGQLRCRNVDRQTLAPCATPLTTNEPLWLSTVESQSWYFTTVSPASASDTEKSCEAENSCPLVAVRFPAVAIGA